MRLATLKSKHATAWIKSLHLLLSPSSVPRTFSSSQGEALLLANHSLLYLLLLPLHHSTSCLYGFLYTRLSIARKQIHSVFFFLNALFIQGIACFRIPSFLKAESYTTACTCCILLIHSCLDGHLDIFLHIHSYK